MKILVTGSGGFVGKNLVCALENLRDGKDRTRPSLCIDEIFSFDLDCDPGTLAEYAARADFVFHLAGVNRPKDPEEFLTGNRDFTKTLLDTLTAANNPCPVMLSSSVQATLVGRYDSDYGRSKLAGEELLFDYGKETGASVYVFRFPNLFGKWCRPNYNSAVATFCHNKAHGLEITVSDPKTELTLLYIDDLVASMLDLLEGKTVRCDYVGTSPVECENGRFCLAPNAHRVTLGEIVELLDAFVAQPKTLVLPEMEQGSFAKKLYSTYLSYLPREKISFFPEMKQDARGSFTELLRTKSFGQVSVNVSKPSVTKGQHWHHSKWEFFTVVHGRALIQMRKLKTDEILEFYVSGETIETVHMLPGYTHNIINLSDTEDLVTVMWANEPFDPSHPDTYFEEV
ncbi:MAG: NAD-dependent epimerase/dehydratase family protein [Clostridia bacterium]|nr:NAD-dependent epimerase/dehydratase family protein [Clostridia bacterium]